MPTGNNLADQWKVIEKDILNSLDTCAYNGLTTVGEFLLRTAQENAPNDGIREGLELTPVIEGGLDYAEGGHYFASRGVPGEGTMSIAVQISDQKVPYAWAFEFGSGLADKTNPRYIDIYPVNAPLLAFLWYKNGSENDPDYVYKNPELSPEQVAFPHVSHPGVAAHPYLLPALNDNIDVIEEMFARSFENV